MPFTFDTDPDTTILFEMVAWSLENYFGHDHDRAVGLVNDFYHANAARFEDDDYHHDGPYDSAARIHYEGFLRGDPSGFPTWRRDNGHLKPPPEALAYFREHLYEK